MAGHNEDLPEYKRRRQEQAEEFLEWLESKEHLSDVRARRNSHNDTIRAVDFLIGTFDVWPEYMNDDHLNAIGPSSVSTSSAVPDIEQERFLDEAKIHLPPTYENLEDDVRRIIDLPDYFGMYLGTGALGGLPAPNGVITPHIVATRSVEFSEVQEVVEKCLDVYREVYDGGEKAIQEKP